MFAPIAVEGKAPLIPFARFSIAAFDITAGVYGAHRARR